MPGKLPALLQRFENHTLRLFEKHGMKVVGLWLTELGDNSNNGLLYLMEFRDYQHLESAWNAFFNDAEWQAVKKESEVAGALVASVKRTLLRPVPFSRPIGLQAR